MRRVHGVKKRTMEAIEYDRCMLSWLGVTGSKRGPHSLAAKGHAPEVMANDSFLSFLGRTLIRLSHHTGI